MAFGVVPTLKPVRYDQVNAMLLNEFLKEHNKVQELEWRLAQQEKRIESLAAGCRKLARNLRSTDQRRKWRRITSNRRYSTGGAHPFDFAQGKL